VALNASDILGSAEVAGCKVNPRGSNKGTIAKVGVGEGLGGVAAGMIADKKRKAERAEAATSAAPSFTAIAWLALTANELALVDIETKGGLKLSHVLARVPRSEVTSVELGKAAPLISKPLTVTLANGDRWIFEVPALAKGGVREIVAAFS
jgi:uncharacterized spore protein YtfJ